MALEERDEDRPPARRDPPERRSWARCRRSWPAGGRSRTGSIQAAPSGLQAFFAGVRSTSTTDPYSSGTVFTATAPASGAPWTLASGPAAAPSNAYASDWVASTLGEDGAPVTAWTGTSGFYIHKGVDPATPNVKVQAACCAYYASLAGRS
jgi:hypothetical protein